MMASIAKTSKQTKKASVPEEYICPLTKKIMIDPLVNRYDVSYERAAIIDHITIQEKPFCPKTKLPLTVRDLIPNVKLRLEITTYREQTLGEDTTTNNDDEDAIREVECIRAITYAFSPPKKPKKGIFTGSPSKEMKNMLSRFSPGSPTSPLKVKN